MAHIIYWIDAFTHRAFAGNPAGVCLLSQPVSEQWMQSVSAELNLAETAFVQPIGDGHYSLRWFTPTCEVDLCGHATLAAARALWHEQDADTDTLIFATRSGELIAERSGNGLRIALPADKPEPLADLAISQSLGPQLVWLGLSRIGVTAVLANEAAVKNFRPQFEQIAQWPGVLLAVTAESATAEYDCTSRVFAPKIGINEDPVTGAAHCALGPLWAERLNKPVIHARQASSRGGDLTIEVVDKKVYLTGQTQIIFRGECYV